MNKKRGIIMDKKAKDILFKTYWKNGWIDRKDCTTTKEEIEYAKSKGLMFDNITITHDECINEILNIVKKISINKVAQAFLSSLSTRRLDWRSSIASYFMAKKLKKHEYVKEICGHVYDSDGKIIRNVYACGLCRDVHSVGELKKHTNECEKNINEDLNVLNFERIKWGGVRHGALLYTLLDLRIFHTEKVTKPTNEDIKIFKDILSTIETSHPDDYPGTLEKRLSKSIKSSKYERNTLIETMACIEILKPASYDRPIRGQNDWKYAEYWRGEDKYNKDAVNKFFEKYL
jgi:hypothetical protein